MPSAITVFDIQGKILMQNGSKLKYNFNKHRYQ